MARQKGGFSTTAGNRVEVAFPQPQAVAVRDSKNATGPVPDGAWHSFRSTLRDDRVGQ